MAGGLILSFFLCVECWMLDVELHIYMYVYIPASINVEHVKSTCGSEVGIHSAWAQSIFNYNGK